MLEDVREAERGEDWEESSRIDALRSFGVLDTPPEPEFDGLCRIAARACRAPMALISLVAEDRQFFKAEVGLGIRETPLHMSVCRTAMLERELLVVPDLRDDGRFDGNPLVTGLPGLRFYAGARLQTLDGLPVGTLCVLDTAPRPQGLSPDEADTLTALARQVMTLLEHRRALKRLSWREKELRQATELLRVITLAAPQPIYMKDRDSRIVFGNPATAKLFGVEPDAIAGQTLPEQMDAETRSAVRAHDLDVLHTGQPATREVALACPDGSKRIFVSSKAPLRDAKGAVIGLVGVATDITDRTRIEEQQNLIQRELNHRIKNNLGTVLAVINATGRHAKTVPEFQQAVADRVHALANTQSLLIEANPGEVALGDVILSELKPHAAGGRLAVKGPKLKLSAEVAQTLGMAVHELVANCMKFGSLSVAAGRVDVTWAVEKREGGRWFKLDWVERNGPRVRRPVAKGFGTALLSRVLARQLGGEVELDFAPAGLQVRIRAPLR